MGFPSKIYSDTYLLYVRMNLHAGSLESYRLAITKVSIRPKRKGSIAYSRPVEFLKFICGIFYPAGHFKGLPVRFLLQGTIITKIENRTTGEEMFSLELEPELITGLYDRVWEERRVVAI